MVVVFEIHDEILWNPGHLVHRWGVDVGRSIKAGADAAAPLNKRTKKSEGAPPRGTLKASNHFDVIRQGTRNIGLTIGNTAPYAIYVHEGTGPIFKAKRNKGRFAGGGMWLPSNNFGKGGWRQRVSGQSANPFLWKGVAIASLKHPALRSSTVARKAGRVGF